MSASVLKFLCACDEHDHHGHCDDNCICIQQVRRDSDRSTPAGHFAVITTYVWLTKPTADERVAGGVNDD